MSVKRTFAALALAGAVAGLPIASQAQIAISVNIAPPVLPVYDQPECPGDGYIWTPGYWAWDASVADYYWVPGTWVEAPQVGYLWTPGYWGYDNGAYLWNVGYWGPHVGFYGGVNYGFGYGGFGYEGGYWNNNRFFYNTAINRVNVTVIHNTYMHNVTVVNNTHVAFNGGPGGINARPQPGEAAAFHENHSAPTGAQMQHANFAQGDRSQFANANHGQPPAAAMARPAESTNAFHGSNVTPGARPVAAAPTNNGAGMNGRNGFANAAARPAAIPVTSIGAPNGGFLQKGQQTPGQPSHTVGGYAGNTANVRTVPTRQQPAQQHTAPAEHGGGEHK